ncbi:hypothetical protein B0H11DRAFT_2313513 [Mycena galericulata]|nr:hypothetical protein B0H11DRAFT_2386218 [Mycena galericulata]KAJ7507556.1 hypothetical protein B0H11DRAFT_2313513 [Mycena galericulata]
MSLLRVRVSASRVSRPFQCPRRPFYSSFRRSSQGYFRFLDQVPENTVFWGIIGLNVGVFGMSWWARKKLEVERDPSMYLWMQKHFMSNWKNLSEGRIWTLLTSTFTHSDRDITHILFNGFTFYFMAPLTLSILVTGNSSFYTWAARPDVFLCLTPLNTSTGGALAELGSMAYKNIWQRGRDPYACGASAAIYSVLSFLAFQAPQMTLLIYGIIPVPIWLAVGGLFSYDIYRTAADTGGSTNTTAHVGGMLAGAGYFVLRRFRIF